MIICLVLASFSLFLVAFDVGEAKTTVLRQLFQHLSSIKHHSSRCISSTRSRCAVASSLTMCGAMEDEFSDGYICGVWVYVGDAQKPTPQSQTGWFSNQSFGEDMKSCFRNLNLHENSIWSISAQLSKMFALQFFYGHQANEFHSKRFLTPLICFEVLSLDSSVTLECQYIWFLNHSIFGCENSNSIHSV